MALRQRSIAEPIVCVILMIGCALAIYFILVNS